jgi:hypothetical protein
MINRAKGLAISVCVFVCGFASPVFAHCDNARDLCAFAVNCIAGASNATHLTRVQDGVRTNNGNEVWGELQGCISGSDNLEKHGAGSCSDGDYVSVGKAALDVHQTSNPTLCNQLHE